MSRKHQESGRITALLRRLCEAETADDGMICHDGGFRYAGDFMSMERGLIEAVPLVSDADYRMLLDAGFIEEVDPSLGRAAGFRITEHGREVAFRI